MPQQCRLRRLRNRHLWLPTRSSKNKCFLNSCPPRCRVRCSLRPRLSLRRSNMSCCVYERLDRMMYYKRTSDPKLTKMDRPPDCRLRSLEEWHHRTDRTQCKFCSVCVVLRHNWHCTRSIRPTRSTPDMASYYNRQFRQFRRCILQLRSAR